jgi:hypothetical protein
VTTAEAQVGLQFKVRYPDGRSEQLTVDAERALIGSAAHCEVRLPKESAAPEHVEVFASEGRVHLAARNRESPPMLDGVPFTGGPWPTGRVLSIGATRLTVDRIQLGDRRRSRSPFWLLAPVPLVGIVATLVYAQAGTKGDPPVPDAPQLFDPPIATCPMPVSDQLQPFAAEKLRLALAKRETGPFSRRDAVEAVPLFEVAAACFRLARDPDNEREAATDAVTLRRKLEEEYLVRRVRLEHAYRINDSLGAKRELNVLMPMTAHRPGAYADWLAWLNRYATFAIEQAQTNKGRLGR